MKTKIIHVRTDETISELDFPFRMDVNEMITGPDGREWEVICTHLDLQNQVVVIIVEEG
jgi:hypothetical protein